MVSYLIFMLNSRSHLALRTLSSLLLFLTFMKTTQAQVLAGIDAGISGDYLNTNIDNRAASRMMFYPGYAVNVAFEYPLNERFSMEVIPGICQKNYMMQ